MLPPAASPGADTTDFYPLSGYAPTRQLRSPRDDRSPRHTMLAATSKCLAQSNKSRIGGGPTKERKVRQPERSDGCKSSHCACDQAGSFNVEAGARGIAFRRMSRRRRQRPTGYQINRGRASYRQATRAIQPGDPFRPASDGPVSLLKANGK
jgi:hypothetical protein